MSGLRCVVAQWMLPDGASIIQNEGTAICLLSQSLHHSVTQCTTSSEYDLRLTTSSLRQRWMSKIRIIVSRVFRFRRQWKGEIRRHLQLQTHSLK